MLFRVTIVALLLLGCAEKSPVISTKAATWREDLGVPVLCYHQIVTDEQYRKKPDTFQVTVEQFREQIAWLAENKFYTISPDELLAYTQGEKKLDFSKGRRPIVITFDDGNDDFINHAQKILEEKNYRGVLFIYPTYIMAKKKRSLRWPEINAAREAGHYIESHTMWHPKLITMSDAEQRAQFVDSRKILNANGGAQVKHLAYPFGLYTSRSVEILKELGYTSAHTTFPGGNQVGESPYLMRRYLIVKSDDPKQFARKTLLRSLPLGYIDTKPGEFFDGDRDIALKLPPELDPRSLKVRIFSTQQQFTYDKTSGAIKISIHLSKKKVSVLEIVYKENGIEYQAHVLINHTRAKHETDVPKKKRKKKRRTTRNKEE